LKPSQLGHLETVPNSGHIEPGDATDPGVAIPYQQLGVHPMTPQQLQELIDRVKALTPKEQAI
jgi:hypothetical protein